MLWPGGLPPRIIGPYQMTHLRLNSILAYSGVYFIFEKVLLHIRCFSLIFETLLFNKIKTIYVLKKYFLLKSNCLYTYTIRLPTSLSLSLYIYIYMYVCECVCVCACACSHVRIFAHINLHISLKYSFITLTHSILYASVALQNLWRQWLQRYVSIEDTKRQG